MVSTLLVAAVVSAHSPPPVSAPEFNEEKLRVTIDEWRLVTLCSTAQDSELNEIKVQARGENLAMADGGRCWISHKPILGSGAVTLSISGEYASTSSSTRFTFVKKLVPHKLKKTNEHYAPRRIELRLASVLGAGGSIDVTPPSPARRGGWWSIEVRGTAEVESAFGVPDRKRGPPYGGDVTEKVVRMSLVESNKAVVTGTWTAGGNCPECAGLHPMVSLRYDQFALAPLFVRLDEVRWGYRAPDLTVNLEAATVVLEEHFPHGN